MTVGSVLPFDPKSELVEAVAMAEKFLPAEHANLKEYRETLSKCKAAMAEGAEQSKPDAK